MTLRLKSTCMAAAVAALGAMAGSGSAAAQTYLDNDGCIREWGVIPNPEGGYYANIYKVENLCEQRSFQILIQVDSPGGYTTRTLTLHRVSSAGYPLERDQNAYAIEITQTR